MLGKIIFREAMSLEQLVLWAGWVLKSGQAWHFIPTITHSYLVFLSVTFTGRWDP